MHIHLRDCSADRHISEFFIKVVNSGTRVIFNHHSVGSHYFVVFLEDLIHRKNLSLRGLQLVLVFHLLPKFGFRYDRVFRKDSHRINLSFLLRGGQTTASHQILVNMHLQGSVFLYSYHYFIYSFFDFYWILSFYNFYFFNCFAFHSTNFLLLLNDYFYLVIKLIKCQILVFFFNFIYFFFFSFKFSHF